MPGLMFTIITAQFRNVCLAYIDYSNYIVTVPTVKLHSPYVQCGKVMFSNFPDIFTDSWIRIFRGQFVFIFFTKLFFFFFL